MPEQNFDSFWNSPVYTPEARQKKQSQQFKELGYGLFDPIQRAALFLSRGAESIGVPGAAEEAAAQEARIKRREAQVDPESGTVLAGQLLSPVPYATGAKLYQAFKAAPKLGAIAGGASTAMYAPIDPNEKTYWSDAYGAGLFGGALGLGAYGIGSMLKPRMLPEAEVLISKGVPVPARMATTGHMQDFLDTAHSIKSGLGIGNTADAGLESAFNAALANDILRPIGASTTGNTKSALVGDVRTKVSEFYDNAYKNLGTALPSQRFVVDVNNIRASARTELNAKTYNVLNSIIDDNIIRRFSIQTKAGNRAITGEKLKDMRKYFGELYRKVDDAAYDADVDKIALKGYVKNLRDSVEAYTDNIDPTGTIKTANRAWAEMSVFEKAASKNVKGNTFSIDDLEQAVAGSSDTQALAAGKGKLQQKATPYLKVLEDKSPSPWKVARQAAVAGAVIGGGAYSYLQNPAAAAAILAAAGIAPAAIEASVRHPNRYAKLLGHAIKILGPTAAANIAAQAEAREAKQLRKEINIKPWPPTVE